MRYIITIILAIALLIAIMGCDAPDNQQYETYIYDIYTSKAGDELIKVCKDGGCCYIALDSSGYIIDISH